MSWWSLQWVEDNQGVGYLYVVEYLQRLHYLQEH